MSVNAEPGRPRRSRRQSSGGQKRRGDRRQVDGVLLLDKPAGITSNGALGAVKRLFNATKAGHTGSLDPLATGMLPICMGEATKMSAFLLDADKEYQVTLRFGARTDTGDAEGSVVEEAPVPALDAALIETGLARFRGEIMQVPPMYSALKQGGKRLYELARQGIEVEREPRPVTIHALDLVGWASPDLSLRVMCSKGTYIRTLAEDIAAALGSLAHVVSLRRIAVGPYQDAMVDMEQLEALATEGLAELDGKLLPVDSAVAAWPRIELNRDMSYYLLRGQPLQVPGAPTQGWMRLYGPQGRFLGVGEVEADGRVAPRRLIRTG